MYFVVDEHGEVVKTFLNSWSADIYKINGREDGIMYSVYYCEAVEY